jgi:hypothetical protein
VRSALEARKLRRAPGRSNRRCQPDDVPGGRRERGAQLLSIDRHGCERRGLDPVRRVLGVGRLEAIVMQFERLLQLETPEARGAQVQRQLLVEMPVEREEGERARQGTAGNGL